MPVPSRPVRALAAFAAALLSGALAAGAVAAPADADGGSTAPIGDDVRRAVYVGDNWAGTATVLAPGSFRPIGRLDIVPDYTERMTEIAANPYRLAFFLGIRALIGEGNDQFVDDMYASRDGRLLVVSRPSFADVVGLDIASGEIVWRFPVEGVRSDHMAVSPDGTRVVVSASTGNVVHLLRMRDGKELGRFRSGGSPHESIFIDGGKRILHASIGTVYSPFDDPNLPDPLEDDRVLQIVNAKTLEIERRYDLRGALDARGLDDVSIAVRPMTLSPDEQTFYFQLSFFHGFVAMDRRSGDIVRVKRLPNRIPNLPRQQYLLDSAHHGIAMNPAGTKICVAGTMSDYATVVDARTFRTGRLLNGGLKPYWVTPSWDGKYCYISWSGSDTVSRISYRTGRIVDTTRVGDHPQRVRNGVLARDIRLGFADSSSPLRTSAPTVWERPSR
ncbi:YncE family protein [Nocardioides sp.]|uniref:YncE family protein n=1 Tax=Nocardioides sp. TaxID=35761 RepID=UPI00351653BD